MYCTEQDCGKEKLAYSCILCLEHLYSQGSLHIFKLTSDHNRYEPVKISVIKLKLFLNF